MSTTDCPYCGGTGIAQVDIGDGVRVPILGCTPQCPPPLLAAMALVVAEAAKREPKSVPITE